MAEEFKVAFLKAKVFNQNLKEGKDLVFEDVIYEDSGNNITETESLISNNDSCLNVILNFSIEWKE